MLDADVRVHPGHHGDKVKTRYCPRGDIQIKTETETGEGTWVCMTPSETGNLITDLQARAQIPQAPTCFSCKPPERLKDVAELLGHVHAEHPEVWDAYQQWVTTGPPAANPIYCCGSCGRMSSLREECCGGQMRPARDGERTLTPGDLPHRKDENDGD